MNIVNAVAVFPRDARGTALFVGGVADNFTNGLGLVGREGVGGGDGASTLGMVLSGWSVVILEVDGIYRGAKRSQTLVHPVKERFADEAWKCKKNKNKVKVGRLEWRYRDMHRPPSERKPRELGRQSVGRGWRG